MRPDAQDSSAASQQKYILYWMRTAVRGHENPALDVARRAPYCPHWYILVGVEGPKPSGTNTACCPVIALCPDHCQACPLWLSLCWSCPLQHARVHVLQGLGRKYTNQGGWRFQLVAGPLLPQLVSTRTLLYMQGAPHGIELSHLDSQSHPVLLLLAG